MKSYDSYRDSEVEWIGEIPSDWIVSKFKFDTLNPVQYGINISSDKYVDEGIRFVRITDINEDGSLNPNNGRYLISDDVPEEFLLNKYDVLFCRSGHTVGKSYFHTTDGQFTSGGYLVRFNFRNYTESKFIFYLSKTNFYWDWIKLNTVVSTIENVNGDKYQNFIYPKPPHNEQQQIVSFLDTKTSFIDSLIEKTQRKIELLKEKRTSLINEVVTKGLNPNVEMKDSGVEWIGKIPSGWKITPLRYLGSFQNGISKGSEFFGTGYPFMSYGDVYNNDITPQELKGKVELEGSEIDRYSIKRGDVFFTRTSETIDDIGVCSTCFNTIENSGFSGFVIRFRFHENVHLPEFSRYHFQTHWKKVIIESKMNIVTRSSLSQQVLGDTPVLIPDTSEQQQIVEYLDEQTKLIDKTISIEEKRIELLKEYRQSLISEVVTGKRKVD